MTQLTYTNIFDAIEENPAEAADLEFRSDLLIVMRGIFESRDWRQADIMEALAIPQSRASELCNGKIDKFSSDKLLGYLAALGVRFKPNYKKLDVSKIKVSCDVQVSA